MRDLFASKHCMGQYSINCWTTDGEYTLVVRPIGSSPTQVRGVFCQVFCCRSFLSRKSAIFTLAERASPAVIDPFVWSPGPAACHWSASLPFLRKRSGVKGAQRRFAGLPLIPDRFRNLLQRSAPMALSVQPPRIQQLYKLDRSEREPTAIGRGSCLLCERTRHSLVCGEISRSRP